MPTTIAVAGLPLDATYRELKNFCRLCPGFEAASPNIRQGRSPLLFVKFVAEAAAAEAIYTLQQMCFDQDRDPSSLLKAEFARNEMAASLSPLFGLTGSAIVPPSKNGGSIIVPPAKRARSEMPYAEVLPTQGVDTLACKLDETGQAQQFFEQTLGFVLLKVNPNKNNCFVKFATHSYAQQALSEARSVGFVVDYAKRSLEDCDIVPGHIAAPTSPQKLPVASSGGSVNTLACKNEFDRQTYQAFFGGLHGFETLRFTQTGGNCFVKFSSAAWAEEALTFARQAGFTIDFAKRNLDESDSHPQPIAAQQPSSMPAPGAVTTLACKLEGYHDQDSTQDFFSSMPGFEIVKVTSFGSVCFVKFDSHPNAQTALNKALQAGYIVDFARRELGDVSGSQPQANHQPSHQPPDGGNTLACKKDDHTEESIHSYFVHCYGFEKLKVNNAGTVCFLKFSDYASAEEAIRLARLDGFTLDFAKRNLSETDATFEPSTENAAKVSTLACKLTEAVDDHTEVFFQQLPGFETTRFASSGKIVFVKFTDAVAAEYGLREARQAGFVIEFARREL